jgi:hypothetical protein
MAQDTRFPTTGDGPAPTPRTSARASAVQPPIQETREPSLGDLFRELAQESTLLIKQELGLARAEMRDNFRELARDAAMLAVGGGILLMAALVLTAFLVAGLGDMLGNEYWLGALIVGVAYALIGGVLLLRGRRGMRRDDLKPDRTIESLNADRRWAQAEARQVKQDLTR